MGAQVRFEFYDGRYLAKFNVAMRVTGLIL